MSHEPVQHKVKYVVEHSHFLFYSKKESHIDNFRKPNYCFVKLLEAIAIEDSSNYEMKQGFQRGMFLRTGTKKDSENEENNMTFDISEHHWMIDELRTRIEDKHCQPGLSSTIPGIMVASTSETTSLKLTEKKEKNKVRRNRNKKYINW